MIIYIHICVCKCMGVQVEHMSPKSSMVPKWPQNKADEVA